MACAPGTKAVRVEARSACSRFALRLAETRWTESFATLAKQHCREMAQLAGSYRQQETAEFHPERAYDPGTNQILTTSRLLKKLGAFADKA